MSLTAMVISFSGFVPAFLPDGCAAVGYDTRHSAGTPMRQRRRPEQYFHSFVACFLAHLSNIIDRSHPEL
jgi:hypothetical protein